MALCLFTVIPQLSAKPTTSLNIAVSVKTLETVPKTQPQCGLPRLAPTVNATLLGRSPGSRVPGDKTGRVPGRKGVRYSRVGSPPKVKSFRHPASPKGAEVYRVKL